MDSNKQLTTIAITSLVLITLAALLIVWKSSRDETDSVTPLANDDPEATNVEENNVTFNESVDSTLDEAEQDIAYAAYRVELLAELVELKAALANEEVNDQTVDTIVALRQKLNTETEKFNDNIQQELQEIDTQLDDIEQNVRMNTAEALATLDALINDLSEDETQETQ